MRKLRISKFLYNEGAPAMPSNLSYSGSHLASAQGDVSTKRDYFARQLPFPYMKTHALALAWLLNAPTTPIDIIVFYSSPLLITI